MSAKTDGVVKFDNLLTIINYAYVDSVDNKKMIRSSTGLAMDIFSPIGPLSFSYSFPITKTSSDVTESFRFNLGTTF